METRTAYVKVGIAGTNWWSDSIYMPALVAHPQAEVCAVVGRNLDHTREFAAQWNIPSTLENLDQVLSSEPVDAVIIWYVRGTVVSRWGRVQRYLQAALLSAQEGRRVEVNEIQGVGSMFKIANAPCSWGVIEGIDGERGGYVQVIDEMQQTGYAGTELGDWGFMPTDPAFLTQELGSRHLNLLASWVSVFLHEVDRHPQSADDAVRTAKLLAAVGGHEDMIVLGNDPYGDPVRTQRAGRITPELGMSDKQWQTFAEGANFVARRVMDEAGLRTVFHHHIGTWVETPEETRRLLEMTDPAILGLCFDTGHWAFAGGDPVQGIHEFADRIWHVHFKDHEPNVARQSLEYNWDGPTSVGHGVFCELGRGDVDFPGVLKALQDIGYSGWIVVEQDVLPGMGTPRESAQRNREYLRSIGL